MAGNYLLDGEKVNVPDVKTVPIARGIKLLGEIAEPCRAILHLAPTNQPFACNSILPSSVRHSGSPVTHSSAIL